MDDCVADTHSLIWYLEDSPRLGPVARQAFAACDRGEIVIYIPTICLVEIVYLREKDRLPADLVDHLTAALASSETGLLLADLTGEIAEPVAQVPRDTVPDMPDRIIAATALALGLHLLSRDAHIKLSGLPTLW